MSAENKKSTAHRLREALTFSFQGILLVNGYYVCMFCTAWVTLLHYHFSVYERNSISSNCSSGYPDETWVIVHYQPSSFKVARCNKLMHNLNIE